MAKYRITGPDGGTYEVTAPDTATEAEVMAYAQQNYKPKAKVEQPKTDPSQGGGTLQFGPFDTGIKTPEWLDRGLAGVGKAYSDVARGAGQLVGLVDRKDVEEARKLDAPLMNTTAGAVGNILGNVALLAPAAAIPGAATIPGAALIGAGAGLLQPSTSTKETLTNVALGGAGGAAGQAIANKIPALLQSRVNNAATAQAANAQKFQAAQNAAKEGFVIPPADLEPGMLSEAVSGLSGKIKTAQVASARNQQGVDTLARKAIGLKAGDTLDENVLQTIRNQAATQGYAPVRSAGMVQADTTYYNALSNIAQAQQGASRSFPGLADNGVPELVAKLSQPVINASDAVDATRVLRDAADKAFRQGDRTLGKANKQAADAIEDLLERHLTATGNPDALKAFKDARTLIAKTYSVQKGLNPQTGNVSAQALAKQLEKGVPLSGDLKTVAQAAQAFPKAFQSLKEAPKAVSPLDFAVATTTGLSTGNPLSAVLLGARPLARNALLSGPVQARALQQTNRVPLTQATQAVLQNQLAQMLLAPAGMATGIQLAQ